MLEKDVERYLCQRVKKLKGIPYKFTSPNRRSVPDRLCVFQLGVVVFIECKRPGGKLTKLQEMEHKRLKELDHWVETVYNKKDVDVVLNLVVDRINMEVAKL